MSSDTAQAPDVATLLDEAVRRLGEYCPCRDSKEGRCIKDILCVCCTDYREKRRPLADPCEWVGHAALARAVALARLVQHREDVGNSCDDSPCGTCERLRREAEALGDV